MKGTRIADAFSKVIKRRTPWIYGGNVTSVAAADPNDFRAPQYVDKRSPGYRSLQGRPLPTTKDVNDTNEDNR